MKQNSTTLKFGGSAALADFLGPGTPAGTCGLDYTAHEVRPAGNQHALLQFETDLNRSLLPEPKRVLPMLDQIAGDSHFVDIARQRARSLAERIRHQG